MHSYILPGPDDRADRHPQAVPKRSELEEVRLVIAELERFDGGSRKPRAFAELCGRHPPEKPKLSHGNAEGCDGERGSEFNSHAS